MKNKSSEQVKNVLESLKDKYDELGRENSQSKNGTSTKIVIHNLTIEALKTKKYERYFSKFDRNVKIEFGLRSGQIYLNYANNKTAIKALEHYKNEGYEATWSKPKNLEISY